MEQMMGMARDWWNRMFPGMAMPMMPMMPMMP